MLASIVICEKGRELPRLRFVAQPLEAGGRRSRLIAWDSEAATVEEVP